MSTNLNIAVVIVWFTLIAVMLVGCDSEPSLTGGPPSTAMAASATRTSTESLEPTATAAVATRIPFTNPTPSLTPAATPVSAEFTPAASPQATSTTTAAPVTPTPTAVPKPTATSVPAVRTPTATPEPNPTAAPVTEADSPLVFDPLVVRGTLTNGLTYYLRRNEEPRNRGQLSLVVKAGSVLEEEDQRGLAHFVEHMAFNGTERFAKQQIIEYLESIGSTFGGDLNAQTGYDYTTYWLEIPTDDPEIIETAFQILSDWSYAVTFQPDEVELERSVILEEWRGRQGFNSRLQDNLFPLLYGSSRYAERMPIGIPNVIETAPVERLKDFYERWYKPDLMAVIAVGDFDTEVIEAKVRNHFAPPPEGDAPQERAAKGSPTDRPRFDIPDHDELRVSVLTDPEAPGTQLILASKVIPERGNDLTAFRRGVIERLAFMMLNARLSERRQVADPPYLWAGGSRGPLVDPLDILTFSAWVERDGVERGFGALLEEIQRIRLHGFTDTELAREKVNLLSSVERVYKQRNQLQSGDLAQSYIDNFLSETPILGIETEWELYQEVLPQVTLEEVDELSVSWIKPAEHSASGYAS